MKNLKPEAKNANRKVLWKFVIFFLCKISEAYPQLDAWVALRGKQAKSRLLFVSKEDNTFKLPVNEILVVLVSKIITYESKKNTNSYLFNSEVFVFQEM